MTHAFWRRWETIFGDVTSERGVILCDAPPGSSARITRTWRSAWHRLPAWPRWARPIPSPSLFSLQPTRITTYPHRVETGPYFVPILPHVVCSLSQARPSQPFAFLLISYQEYHISVPSLRQAVFSFQSYHKSLPSLRRALTSYQSHQSPYFVVVCPMLFAHSRRHDRATPAAGRGGGHVAGGGQLCCRVRPRGRV